MAFCNNCGAQVQDGTKFCGSCGQPMASENTASQQNQQSKPGQQQQQGFQQSIDLVTKLVQNTADETSSMDPADIEKNKVIGGLAYFIFFLPLIACPESKYGRFHANQGLLYLILFVAGGIVRAVLSSVIYAISWRLWWLSSLLSLIIWVPILIIGVSGLINGFSGKAKELPIIGQIKIIK